MSSRLTLNRSEMTTLAGGASSSLAVPAWCQHPWEDSSDGYSLHHAEAKYEESLKGEVFVVESANPHIFWKLANNTNVPPLFEEYSLYRAKPRTGDSLIRAESMALYGGV